ncbi:MAG: TraB/GumN family protein [Deltaproteobacteria bacterium]|nr:TraB/GumN family protein [Deltaproteobacteria bacterium]MBW1955109.1 TraB/GumN family protein [Deltaproteobacteria bacterium]
MENEPEDVLVHPLTYQDKEILLLGTAHVSRDSARLVRSVIEWEQPDTVAVELCRSRYQTLVERKAWEDTDIFKVIREKKGAVLLLNLVLASFQKRIAKTLGVTPGQEMLQAVASAHAVGATVYLADRDLRVTLTRVWRSMGFFTKLKLFFQMLLSLGEAEKISEAEIEKMKRQDMIEAFLADMGAQLPMLKEILIDERDRYLAEKLKNAPGKKIVAVVGAGHLPGIRSHWNETIDLKALETIPPRGPGAGLFKWFIPLFVVGLVTAGFFFSGSGAAKEMISWWILANAILAGLGAAAALARPLTILSAVLAAPLTSLNPLLAAGWVSGMVETLSRRPRVKDFQNLPLDILSIKGFWKNAFTRILLVVVFTNLGSTLGTLVALPLMIRVL